MNGCLGSSWSAHADAIACLRRKRMCAPCAATLVRRLRFLLRLLRVKVRVASGTCLVQVVPGVSTLANQPSGACENYA